MTNVPPVTDARKGALDILMGAWLFISIGLVIAVYGFSVGMDGMIVETVTQDGMTGVTIDMTADAIIGPMITSLGIVSVLVGNAFREAAMKVVA